MPRVRSLLAAALVLTLVAPAARATCGAEGCPFVREAFGSGGGRFAFDLRYMDVTQDALWNGSREVDLADVISETEQHGEVELFTRTRSWVGEGRARVNADLEFSATLPYLQRKHRHWIAHTPSFNPSFVNEWEFEGLGDATVLGHYRVFHRADGPAITLQGGVKLPTGRRHVSGEALDNQGIESTLEPSARPGTGSTDWLAGLFVSQPLPWKNAMPLSASVLARWNTRGTDDFKVGDEVQVGLTGGYEALDRVRLFGQINYAAHGSEESAEASEHAHSGMRSLFLTPGVNVRVSQAVSVYGLVQLRAWGESDAPSVAARNHWVFGTTYSLGR